MIGIQSRCLVGGYEKKLSRFTTDTKNLEETQGLRQLVQAQQDELKQVCV